MSKRKVLRLKPLYVFSEFFISSHAETKNTAVPTPCKRLTGWSNKKTPAATGTSSPAVENIETRLTVPLFIP